MKKIKDQIPIKQRFGAPIGFLLSLASVYVFWQQSAFLLIVLLLISAFTLWVYDFRFMRTYLTVSLMGPIAEIIAINAGPWEYVSPAFFGVPLWLFPLWGMAGLCFLSVAIYYNDVKMDKK